MSPHREGDSAPSFQNGKNHIPGVPSFQCHSWDWGGRASVAVLEWGVTVTWERWWLFLGSLLGACLLWGGFILDFPP